MYTDYLESRGISRIKVERTEKRPGDLVLNRLDQPTERVEASENVFAMRDLRGRFVGRAGR